MLNILTSYISHSRGDRRDAAHDNLPSLALYFSRSSVRLTVSWAFIPVYSVMVSSHFIRLDDSSLNIHLFMLINIRLIYEMWNMWWIFLTFSDNTVLAQPVTFQSETETCYTTGPTCSMKNSPYWLLTAAAFCDDEKMLLFTV